jgi:hypothetical protein
MKVTLSSHLQIRLEQRKIPQSYPEIIVKNPDKKYFDLGTNHQIAVKQLEYNGKLRPMAVSYDIIDSEIQIITIHPINKQEIENKLTRRRWIKNEEN